MSSFFVVLIMIVLYVMKPHTAPIPLWSVVMVGYIGFMFGRLLLKFQLEKEGFVISYDSTKELGKGKYSIKQGEQDVKS
jgi:hypothetical protein